MSYTIDKTHDLINNIHTTTVVSVAPEWPYTLPSMTSAGKEDRYPLQKDAPICVMLIVLELYIFLSISLIWAITLYASMQCGTRIQENSTVFGLKLVYGDHQIKRFLKNLEHPYRSIVKMEDTTT